MHDDTQWTRCWMFFSVLLGGDVPHTTMTHSGLGVGCASVSCSVVTSHTRQLHTVDSVLDVLQRPVRWRHPTHGNDTQWTRCWMFFSVLFGGDIPHTAQPSSALIGRKWLISEFDVDESMAAITQAHSTPKTIWTRMMSINCRICSFGNTHFC